MDPMILTADRRLKHSQRANLLDGMPDRHRQTLLQRAREGNADAFARLYDIYTDRVYDYMYFHVRDEQTAEDLAANVFSRAWKNLHCYDPDRLSFGTWLYLVARKAVIEFAETQPGGLSVADIVSPADKKGQGEYEDLKPCFED